MKKERIQLLVLIGMWAVGGLMVFYFVVLSPFLGQRGKAASELLDLESNIEKARVAAQTESKLREEHRVAMADLQHAMEQYIVPPESPLSWATEKVYAAARAVGVDIKAVTPTRVNDAAWDIQIKGGRFLRPYAVQIITECGYAQMVALVESLEKSNPYLCVSGLTVAGQDFNILRHQVSLIVEWPMWGRPPGLGQVEPAAPPKPRGRS